MRLSVKLSVTPWCLTLCNPMDCSPPGSSVLGILQARILEWVAISFSRGSSRPRDQTLVSCIVILLVTHKYQTQEHKEHFLPWDCFPLLETHAIWISEKTPVLFQTQIRVFMKSLLTGLASSQTSFSHLITFVRSILFIYTYTLSMQNSLWVRTNM